jgi:hypothetical protein
LMGMAENLSMVGALPGWWLPDPRQAGREQKPRAALDGHPDLMSRGLVSKGIDADHHGGARPGVGCSRAAGVIEGGGGEDCRAACSL